MQHMASDRAKALIAIAKIAVSLVVGYGLALLWISSESSNSILSGTILGDPNAPYVGGLIAACMVYLLLSKLNKGSD